MTTYNTILSNDIKTTTTTLNQLIDFVEEDISGSATRKKYQVFVTGAAGEDNVTNSVTSSLFHTVFDQSYTLQTANELFDMTIGLHTSSLAILSSSEAMDINGKLLFPSKSLMMREKHNIYRQFAQHLLGNASAVFHAPFSGFKIATDVGAISGDGKALPDNITEALFFTFKRLFVRDGIKRETFAMRLFSSSSDSNIGPNDDANLITTTIHPPTGAFILTDVGSAASIERSSVGGDVGNIVLASDTSRTMGLMFYQQGIGILDMNKVFDLDQNMSGTINCVGSVSKMINHTGSFLPHFLMSGSIDNILDHIATTRFGSGSNTFLTFQNNTQINSTLIFCRAEADDMNYSSNPTYTDSEGRIVVIDESESLTQKSFTFVTTVGLYDGEQNLIAVAKLSRPVEKNDEKDLTFRVRLDF